MPDQRPDKTKPDQDLDTNLRKQIRGFRGRFFNEDKMDKHDNTPTAENLTRTILEDSFNLPDSYKEKDKKKKELYTQFYIKFITYIIKEYTKDNLDAGILLAMNGLLPGYGQETCEERCRQYVKDHAKDDSRLKADWSNPYQNIQKTYEPKIIDYMVPLLVKEISENEGVHLLDTAKKIASELDLDIIKINNLSTQTLSEINSSVSFPIEPVSSTMEPKSSIRDKTIKAAVIASAVLILYFILHNKNSKQIEPGQIQHESVTYSEIQHEDVSSGNVPLDKSIFEEVSVYDDEEKEVKRIEILAGESSVLSAHFSPDDADASNLDISSEDTSKLNIKIIDTGIPGKLPFLAKAEASEDTGCFPTSILVEGSGAIPACVNVYIEPNNLVHYDNEDIQNSSVSKNGGVDNAE